MVWGGGGRWGIFRSLEGLTFPYGANGATLAPSHTGGQHEKEYAYVEARSKVVFLKLRIDWLKRKRVVEGNPPSWTLRWNLAPPCMVLSADMNKPLPVTKREE
jgi:hypothetical protein